MTLHSPTSDNLNTDYINIEKLEWYLDDFCYQNSESVWISSYIENNQDLTIIIAWKKHKKILSVKESKEEQFRDLLNFIISQQDSITENLDEAEWYNFLLSPNKDNVLYILKYLKEKSFYPLFKETICESVNSIIKITANERVNKVMRGLTEGFKKQNKELED